MSGTWGAPISPTGQRDVVVKGALNLHVFQQHLTSLGAQFEVVPLSGNVPAVNFTAYYTHRTVRITADAEQWADIAQWLSVDGRTPRPTGD